MIVPLSLVLLLASAHAQTQGAQSAQPPLASPTQKPEAPVQGPYEFATDIGAFVIVVKADKAPAFDAAMSRLRQAIAAGNDKNRKLQATGWRVLKSAEAPVDGAITYLWLIDPVVKTASYDPIAILKELSPADVQPVFDQLQSAVTSMTRVGLTELLKMGGS